MTAGRKVTLWGVALLLTSLLCVCPNLDTVNFTVTEPDPAELDGLYLPTEATRRMIAEGGYVDADPSFLLLDDGTFVMSDMPDWWRDPWGESYGGLDRGVGSWYSEQSQSWWVLWLDFDSREAFAAPEPTGLLKSVALAGEGQPYSLWVYVGDPDSGDVMIFTQTPMETE